MSKILLNSAFVGSYADNIDNLSREVINFVRADDRKCYIYLSPYGSYTDKSDGVDDILFVKNCGDGVVEILAKAKIKSGVEPFSKGIGRIRGEKTKIKDGDIEEYTKRVKNAEITYGGKTLAQIFNLKDENTYEELVVTMEVVDIVLPKRFIGLTLREECSEDGRIFHLTGKNKLTPQSMRCYFDEDSEKKGEKESFAILKRIIESDVWGESVETYDEQKAKIVENDNFFKATLQQDNEVMFSNMMFYFFQNYPYIFRKFAEEVPELKDIGTMEGNPLWITREEGRMDLKVVTDKYYIIIENKIKSGINGIKGEVDGKIESQLSKYYDIAKKEVKALRETGKDSEKQPVDLTIKGFIFCPNYNEIKMEKYADGKEYTVVCYKKIHKFFNEYNMQHEGIKYMDDFVKALKKHTEEADNEKRNDLMLRLKKRIESIN